MHSLPLFHRIAGTRVVVVGDGDMAVAKRRLVERAGGTVCDMADGNARLAFVALEDPAAAERAAAQLKASGLLVNVADRPELCDFTLPSILERGDVLVAASTGGASAGLAKQLRLRLEEILPSSLAVLAQRLAGERQAMRARWPDAGSRRHALDLALSDGGPLDCLDPAAADRVDGWLASGETPEISQVVEIQLTSADPDDLTLRQARLLGRADVVAHGAEVPSAILARARADAIRLTLADFDGVGAGLTVVLTLANSISNE